MSKWRDAEFDEFYRAHVEAVYAFALSRSSRDLAKDVVVETFAVAWRRRSEVPKRPRAWLCGVARRILSNERRSSQRAEALEVRILANRTLQMLEEDPADEVIGRADMLEAFASLPEGDREVLALVAWCQLTPSEVAGVLGCSAAASAVRLHRARKRLEAAISRNQRNDEPSSFKSEEEMYQ